MYRKYQGLAYSLRWMVSEHSFEEELFECGVLEGELGKHASPM